MKLGRYLPWCKFHVISTTERTPKAERVT